MKTLIIAAATVLSIGIGSAYAGDGDIPMADTFFTELPGVIAQPQVQQAPSAVAANPNAAQTNAFVTSHSRSVSLYSQTENEGANS